MKTQQDGTSQARTSPPIIPGTRRRRVERCAQLRDPSRTPAAYGASEGLIRYLYTRGRGPSADWLARARENLRQAFRRKGFRSRYCDGTHSVIYTAERKEV